MSIASKNINAEKIQGNLTLSSITALTASISGSFLVSGSSIFSGSIQSTEGITGSFSGDGSGIFNLPSSTPYQIITGSIFSKVNVGPNSFIIQSGSSTFLTITNDGKTTIQGDNNDIFLIKNTLGQDVLAVSQSGIISLSTQSIELTSPAINGGIYFTSNSFYVGLD